MRLSNIFSGRDDTSNQILNGWDIEERTRNEIERAFACTCGALEYEEVVTGQFMEVRYFTMTGPMRYIEYGDQENDNIRRNGWFCCNGHAARPEVVTYLETRN